MSDFNFTSAEAQRLGEQEEAIIEKSKDFLTSSLRWSFTLLGAKDLLLNKQATFIMIAIVLIALFGNSSRKTQSDSGRTFINFMCFIIGCLVAGVAIDSIMLNPYIKWVIYGLFLIMVTTNPNYQQIHQEMIRLFKSMCGEISLKLKKLFIQSQGIIKGLLKTNVADREESSMNNNTVIQPTGSDRGGVGEDIV